MSNTYAEVSTTSSPFIHVRFTGEAPNQENFSRYLQELKAIYAPKENLVILFDATKAVLPGLNFQKMQAEWLKENNQLMVDYCLGTAYIIPNLLIRNVLKAIFKFQPQPVPYRVCSNMFEAEEWANSKLGRAN